MPKYSKAKEIDQNQWVISLNKEEEKVYAEMRDAEDVWIDKCQQRGCGVMDLDRRRYLVQVPQGVDLPGFDEMLETRAAFAELAHKIAQEQGKKPTVGNRTTEMPQWYSGDFAHDENSLKPAPAVRIRTRTQTAYRGGALTVEEALSTLGEHVKKLQGFRDNANQLKKKDRIAALEERLNYAEEDARVLMNILNPDGVFARWKSGSALKINVKVAGQKSLTLTMPAILLVPVERPLVVEDAPKRAPKTGSAVLIDELKFFDIFSATETH